ncbi:hypothetical protein ACIGHN_11900 [Acidovorax sp. NPDC077693]|uniref:hypothetical protein n=1 Tax=unclassified Acidovorax TaxID=2684926 RepID=UPI0037C74318
MAGGERSAIAKMAERVSDDLFDWFKWKRIPVRDQNFDCIKPVHAPKKNSNHNHPVDVVFTYHDSYLNKNIYLNTDLKSYAAGSIDSSNIVSALKSLAQTIDCAHVSEEWQSRYVLEEHSYEVRGLLFVYNHDADYDKNFYDVLYAPVKGRGKGEPKAVRLDTLPIQDGQCLHVAEPSLISYLTSVIADANSLHAAGTFPEKQYEFFYPDMKLHKTSGERFSRAATIEMLSGPYLIIRHDTVKKYNESTGKLEERFGEGYVIYYNRSGGSAEEFAYFFDILSGFQIVDGTHSLRVRLVHKSPASDARSNFSRGIDLYCRDWGLDRYRRERFGQIEFEIVSLTRYSFSRTEIGWDR